MVMREYWGRLIGILWFRCGQLGRLQNHWENISHQSIQNVRKTSAKAVFSVNEGWNIVTCVMRREGVVFLAWLTNFAWTPSPLHCGIFKSGCTCWWFIVVSIVWQDMPLCMLWTKYKQELDTINIVYEVQTSATCTLMEARRADHITFKIQIECKLLILVFKCLYLFLATAFPNKNRQINKKRKK